MNTWQERGAPYEGYEYTALMPHYFWDGRAHYWTGMAVKGFEDQYPDNPNCCHDLDIFYGSCEVDGEVLRKLRTEMKNRKISHRRAAEVLGVGIAWLRERIYGRYPFRRAEFNALCRAVGHVQQIVASDMSEERLG